MIRWKLTKGKIYTSLSLSLLLTLSAPMVLSASEYENDSSEKNIWYMKLINFTMPVVKSVALDEDEIAEYDFSLKEKVLEYLGLDIGNPFSIVGKEIAILRPLDSETSSTGKKTAFFINPFKLNDNSIKKEAEQTSNEGVSVPNIDVAEVYNPKIKKTLNSAKPEVLIYHTHTSETYRPSANVTDFPNYIDDSSKNMIAVGDVIANDLEKNYGIAVIHDKTYHNLPNFNLAYSKSGQTVDSYLSKYKDFKLIIDLHRDSVEDKAKMTANFNNTNLARYVFVVGPGNPNKAKNISVINRFASISQTLFPGLLRPGNGGDYGIYYHNKGTKFNQQKSGNAVLLELGSQTNTLDEAKSTALYLSRIIAEYINEKK